MLQVLDKNNTLHLAQDQIEAQAAIDQWSRSGTSNWFYLSGVPGSGKTTVIQQVVQHLTDRGWNICLSSSNDTALSQLASTLPDADARTIHSLMGFFPASKEDGEKALYQTNIKPTWDYDLIVLDEAPTVPAIILEAMAERVGVRWLCLGDVEQLPPVKELRSSLLDYVPVHCRYELYINKRFNNPELVELVSRVRREGISTDVPLSSNVEFLRSYLRRVGNGEDAVFLAYRNVVVDKMVDILRGHIYDAEPGSPPIKGEKILMKMMLGADGKKLIRNNTLATVNYCCDEYIEIMTAEGDYHSIAFDTEGAVAAALKSAFSRKSVAGWAKYHRTVDSFPRYRTPQVRTCHAAQGGSFDHVYLDWSDMAKATNCPQIGYVGVSRARETVMFR